MNRTPYNLIFLAGLLCLSAASGHLYAADPAPAALTQKVSEPAVKSEPAPVASAVKVVAAPAPLAANDTISLDFKDADIQSVLKIISYLNCHLKLGVRSLFPFLNLFLQ